MRNRHIYIYIYIGVRGVAPNGVLKTFLRGRDGERGSNPASVSVRFFSDVPIAGAPWGPVKASGRTGALARVFFCCLFAQLFAFESYMCSCSLAFVILFSGFV